MTFSPQLLRIHQATHLTQVSRTPRARLSCNVHLSWQVGVRAEGRVTVGVTDALDRLHEARRSRERPGTGGRHEITPSDEALTASDERGVTARLPTMVTTSVGSEGGKSCRRGTHHLSFEVLVPAATRVSPYIRE